MGVDIKLYIINLFLNSIPPKRLWVESKSTMIVSKRTVKTYVFYQIFCNSFNGVLTDIYEISSHIRSLALGI